MPLRNNNPKFQVDWLRNFDFIEWKPHFWPILLSFFVPVVAKNDPIFLNIESGPALAPRNNNLKFQVDWLRNFDFIDRKPSVMDRQTDRQTDAKINYRAPWSELKIEGNHFLF